MRPSVAAEGPPAAFAALAVAVSLLVALASLFAAGVVALAVGAHLSAWLALPALIAGAVAGAAVPGAWRVRGIARTLLLALALLGLAAAALAGASRFHDVSWDGQVYHQPAVLALAGGWNPLWDGPLPLDDRPDNLWINHYPKAAWVMQAILFQATGSLEATKGIQLLVLLAAALVVFAALGQSRRAALAAAVVAANPVALVQAFSFYVDGMSASLMTAFIAASWLWLRRPGLAPALAAAGSLVLLVNLKFTGLVYGGVLVAGLALGAWRWWPGRWRGFAALGGTALVAGALGLGFDPYVTNTLSRGHPFHPVAGPGAVDFLRIQLAPGFHDHSRPVRLAVGLLARASNDNHAPVVKPPFTIDRRELAALPEADLRLGGFGPLFSGVLLVGLMVMLARRTLGLPLPEVLPAGAALLLATAFCNPALWWARYVPQLWLLPSGLLAWLLLHPRARPAPPGPAPIWPWQPRPRCSRCCCWRT